MDDQRGAVVPGNGVVARFPGVLCVASVSGPELESLRRLLELCRESAGPAPGPGLARRLAAWLGVGPAPAAGLRFGTVSAAEDGLAVFLLGGVDVRVPEEGTAISGADWPAWTDRRLPRPDAPLVLALGGVDAGVDLLAGVHDLRQGVVPGAGVVLAAPEPVGAAEAADSASPEEPTVHAPEGLPLFEPPPHWRAEPILGVEPSEPPRPPLEPGVPVAAAGGAPRTWPAPGPPPAQPQARGHLCANGHLNDPRWQFCVLCGSRMDERPGGLVSGSRPPLGLLAFDDGATYTVDAEYLLGRMPESDERVRTGTLRPIVVEDRTGQVSRVHAEVRVDNWDVLLVDSGSRNGTLVAPPGQNQWARLAPRQSHRLVPGTRIRIGGRTLVFESPSGVS
jgi:hypothetical protein